jgi:exopolysaccharide biosynthesis polyprenyl glycosylphosphotransferase
MDGCAHQQEDTMNPSQRKTSPVTAVLDSLVALALVVGAVCLANKNQLPPNGLADFLSMRVTLLNGSFSIVFAVLWKQCLESLGLYRRDFTGPLSPTVRVAAGCVIMTALLAGYLESIHTTQPLVPVLESFLVLGFLYEVCRVLISNRMIWSGVEPQRVVILGSGRRASAAWRELRTRHDRARTLLGFVDDRDPAAMPPDIAARFIANVDQLSDYLLKNVVDELIVATPLRSCYDMTQRAVAVAEAVGVRVICLNGAFSLSHGKSLRKHADLFLELTPSHHSRETAETAKRVLDFVGSAAALIALAPLFALIGLLIKLTSPGPVFFVQRRYGFGRRCFDMYKFRSMVEDAPKLQALLETQNEARGPIFKIKNDPRITPLGRFLRRSSLDELPQLWNVFMGEMSLVGPRPMSVRDVSLFRDAQLMRRFSARPGITGSWQVSGRSSLSFDQWMSLDFCYIDDWSLLLDLKILARTVPAVLKRSGAV